MTKKEVVVSAVIVLVAVLFVTKPWRSDVVANYVVRDVTVPTNIVVNTLKGRGTDDVLILSEMIPLRITNGIAEFAVHYVDRDNAAVFTVLADGLRLDDSAIISTAFEAMPVRKNASGYSVYSDEVEGDWDSIAMAKNTYQFGRVEVEMSVNNATRIADSREDVCISSGDMVAYVSYEDRAALRMFMAEVERLRRAGE